MYLGIGIQALLVTWHLMLLFLVKVTTVELLITIIDVVLSSSSLACARLLLLRCCLAMALLAALWLGHHISNRRHIATRPSSCLARSPTCSGSMRLPCELARHARPPCIGNRILCSSFQPLPCGTGRQSAPHAVTPSALRPRRLLQRIYSRCIGCPMCPHELHVLKICAHFV